MTPNSNAAMPHSRKAAQLSLAEVFARLQEPRALAARIEFCTNVASALQATGRALWSFGLAADLPTREALAIVTQMSGDLAAGAVVMYSQENWYAGAALVRQLVEAEYLLFLFAENVQEATQWRQSTSEERKDFFTPAKMRKRSNGRFRTSEYAAHCERGGHPTPLGHMFLAEHATPFASNVWLWSDLAQHLERLRLSYEAASRKIGVAEVRAVAESLSEFNVWLAALVAGDPTYGWFDLSGIKDGG